MGIFIFYVKVIQGLFSEDNFFKVFFLPFALIRIVLLGFEIWKL